MKLLLNISKETKNKICLHRNIYAAAAKERPQLRSAGFIIHAMHPLAAGKATEACDVLPRLHRRS